MAAMGDLAYGYNASGVEQYLQDIKANYLEKAKDQLNDINAIQTCCENEWEGSSRDAFLFNLKQDAIHVGQQFDVLYDILVKEVNGVLDAMSEKDATLIQSDLGAVAQNVTAAGKNIVGKIQGAELGFIGDAVKGHVQDQINTVKTGIDIGAGVIDGILK